MAWRARSWWAWSKRARIITKQNECRYVGKWHEKQNATLFTSGVLPREEEECCLRCLVDRVRSVLLHHLVVIAHDEERRCPLSYEQSPFVFAHDFQCERSCH